MTEQTIADPAARVACGLLGLHTMLVSNERDYGYMVQTITMLLELIKAREMGKRFYYHGYCYDVPSQFDYKMNFHNLESMDWKTGIWHPRPRVPVRRWENLVEQWPPPPSDQ